MLCNINTSIGWFERMGSPYFFWISLAVLGWGVSPILEKLGLLKTSPAMILLIQGLVCALFAGAWILHSDRGEVAASSELGLYTLGIVIGSCIVGDLIGGYAYLKALSFEGVGRTIALISIYPLVTLMLSLLFLHEQLSLVNAAGVLLVVIGIALIG